MDNLSPDLYSRTRDIHIDEFEIFRNVSHSPSKSSSSTISPEAFHRPRSKSMLTKRSAYLYPPEINVKYSPGSTSPCRSRNQSLYPIIKTSFRSKSMKEKCPTGHRRSIYVPLVESEQNFYNKSIKQMKDKEYKTLVWTGDDEIGEQKDSSDIQLYRMRSFKRTSKGIISQADTIKARSIGSLERVANEQHIEALKSFSGEHTSCSKVGLYCNTGAKVFTRLEIQIIGSSFVGKTTMASQFMTSEHICGRMDSVNEDADKFVSVFLDDQEWNIWLHDTENRRDGISNEVTVELLSGMNGYLVVYAIDDMSSFIYAKQVLCDLVEKASRDCVIVIVANKSDLERSREVPSETGKQLAKINRCMFYEVSTALNHKIDDLLIKTLLKIRQNLKSKEKKFLKYPEGEIGTRRVSSLKISGKSIKKFFKRKFNVKSCEMVVK